MAVNKNLLKSKMALHGDTQADLAKAIGNTRTNITSKINAYKFAFTKKEIEIIKERYSLTDAEVQEIFFA